MEEKSYFILLAVL